MGCMSPWRRIPLLLAALLLPLSPALATWSIVVVDTRTGEVAVGTATCLTNLNLRRLVPVVVPGFGAAAVQCMGDSAGTLRPIIWEELQKGTPVDQILARLQAVDPNWDSRQIAIVDLRGEAVAFTGSTCGDWKGERIGRAGDLVYSIQGNVLAGSPVVAAAEYALVHSAGDLAERLMMAMEAADAMGGDGRCSCDPFDPASCGSPPPNFTKSAHCGTMLLARPGDPIELCNVHSCARGNFYLTLNTKERQAGDPNAVDLLRADYDAWRATLPGRPDAYQSIVQPPAAAPDLRNPQPLAYVLDLRDLDGSPILHGGARISLTHALGSAGMSTLHSVTDHGDGTYTVEVMPGTRPGLDLLAFVVDDGVQPVTLWPPQRLFHAPAEQAPFNRRTPIASLDTGAVDLAAWVLQDGLTAYWVGRPNDPLVPEVLRASRPDHQSPFGPPVSVASVQLHGINPFDLCVSEDECEAYLSGFDPGTGLERIWRSTRATAQDPWSPLVPVAELLSGGNDGGMALSPDGLEIVFHSDRAGTYDLWLSRRLTPDAPWEEPVRLGELDQGGIEEYPLFLEHGTRLVWTLRGICFPSFNYADRNPDGSWTFLGELPGSVHPHHETLIADGYDYVGDRLWLTAGDDPASVWLETAEPAFGSLSASNDTISASAGGAVDFAIDVGPDFAGRRYHLLGSYSGYSPGFEYREAIIPLVRDTVTERTILGANQNGLNGFDGFLDAAGRAAPRWVVAPGQLSGPSMLGRLFRFAATASGVPMFITQGVAIEVVP
ncbi:MAG: DUF1028 domain-containing protein [Planctomycetota bacterium]|nr:MAG: DUF1028 domain-containing protein [Planctomycetota bacterium]